MDNDEPEQEIVEAFTALLKAPENARKEFRKLVRWVLEEKRKFLPNVGSSKEQEEFNEEKKRLICLVIYLNKLTSQYNDISLQASFYDVAISAFIAGINLGQYSEPIDIAKKELNSRRQRNNSTEANKAKADRAEIEWRKTALKLAEMALQAGKRSQNDIAEYIMANWKEYIKIPEHKNSNKKPPKYSTLITAISNWQSTRKLQK
jgi:hypothetical protein